MKHLKTNLNLNQKGSLIITVLIGLTLLSAVSLTSTAFMQSVIREIKKNDATLELENSKKLIMSYFADERVCTAHFVGKSMNDTNKRSGLNKVKPDFSLSPTPMNVINLNSSNFRIEPTKSVAKDEIITHDMYYTFKSSTDSSLKYQAISLLIEVDSNSKLVNCRSNIYGEGGFDLCNPDRKGIMRFDASEKQTKVCNGNKWINASRSGGMYSYATNSSGGIGQCWRTNFYTGACSCPSGFKPRRMHDLQTNCGWLYYWYGSGAGCDFELIDCVNEELL